MMPPHIRAKLLSSNIERLGALVEKVFCVYPVAVKNVQPHKRQLVAEGA